MVWGQAGPRRNGNFPNHIILKKTEFVNNAIFKSLSKIVKTFRTHSDKSLYNPQKPVLPGLFSPHNIFFLIHFLPPVPRSRLDNLCIYAKRKPEELLAERDISKILSQANICQREFHPKDNIPRSNRRPAPLRAGLPHSSQIKRSPTGPPPAAYARR